MIPEAGDEEAERLLRGGRLKGLSAFSIGYGEEGALVEPEPL